MRYISSTTITTTTAAATKLHQRVGQTLFHVLFIRQSLGFLNLVDRSRRQQHKVFEIAQIVIVIEIVVEQPVNVDGLDDNTQQLANSTCN